MFDSVKARSARTLLALTAATTVGTTGLAGVAQADDDYDYDDHVTVKVCKKVIDDDGDYYAYGHDYGKDNEYRHARFSFTYKSGYDYGYLKVKADRCKKFEVDRYSTFKLTEHETDGYELEDYVVYGGKVKSEYGDYVVVKVYKKDVTVVVKNSKDHYYDDDDEDDYAG